MIKYLEYPRIPLAVMRLTGVVDRAQLLQGFKSYQLSETTRPGVPRLVDARDVGDWAVDFATVMTHTRFLRDRYNAFDVETRFAVLAPSDVVFGTARMYESAVEPYEGLLRLKAFDNLPDAAGFLGLDVDVLATALQDPDQRA